MYNGVSRGFKTPEYRFGCPNYVPKFKKKTHATQHQLFHIFNANASTPSQTFNLINTLKIVKLKTLRMPVSATQVCLNVSQSIVRINKSRLYIVPVCPNVPLDTSMLYM